MGLGEEIALAAEAAAGEAINLSQDKAALQEQQADIKVLYDQLLETSTRSNLLLNHTPGLGFHVGESQISAASVTLPLAKFVMMNAFLPFAPPQLKDRIKGELWAAFVDELNACGTPKASLLRTCSIYATLSCCIFNPKIQHEFEAKVDEVLRSYRVKFAPHVTAMVRAETNVRTWSPSVDPMARGCWTTQTLYYVAMELTESGWVPPPRDDGQVSGLEKLTAFV